MPVGPVVAAHFSCRITGELTDTSSIELDAHYARLMAEGAIVGPSATLKDGPDSSRAGSLGPSGSNEDGDDEMEAVDTNVNKAEDVEALKNTMVKGTW
jgi:hypothetical protein